MIAMDRIAFSYPRREIFNDFSLDIRAGEATLITGVNGEGKTTLLRLMAGILLPQRGTIVYDRALGPEPRAKIALISDQMNLYEDMSLAEAIRFHTTTCGIQAFDSPLLRKAGLTGTQKIRRLSKGQKLIFHLALLLASQPQVLLIDEVIHSMDVVLRELFLDTLLDMIQDRRVSLVMVNLNYHEIETIIERVVLIQNGRVAVDEGLDALKDGAKRVDCREKIPGDGVIHATRLGDHYEHIVYPYRPGWEGDRQITVHSLNLHEIVRAFMGGFYA